MSEQLLFMDKTQLREVYKKRRKELSLAEQEKASLAIANRSLDLPIWNKAHFHLFLTSAKHNEIDTHPLLTLLQGREKNIAVPKMNSEANTLEHILLNETTSLRINSWGIPEPVNGEAMASTDFDVVFTPLLTFDKKGNRLGYGKGYYDRFFAECRTDCIKVGLAFFPPEESIPTTATDVPLDFCLTPNEVYRF